MSDGSSQIKGLFAGVYAVKKSKNKKKQIIGQFVNVAAVKLVALFVPLEVNQSSFSIFFLIVAITKHSQRENYEEKIKIVLIVQKLVPFHGISKALKKYEQWLN